MELRRTDRGFERLEHTKYPDDGDNTAQERIVQASSAVNDSYDDSFERPGTSYLWVGRDHHLNREQVAELIERLQAWLTTGSMAVATDAEPTRPA